MKRIQKLSLLAAVTTIVAGAAYADDPQLQNRLALQRQMAERSRTGPTIGLYVGRSSIGKHEVGVRPGKSNASGQPVVGLHKGRGDMIDVPLQR
jgi:hypothetical protein